jgi:ribonuclease HI
MKECHIYVETSLKWPSKGSGIVGLIFTDKADEYTKQLFGQVKDSTEYQAVLVGIKNALRYCSSFDVINIHLSCRNVASGFVWLPSWKQNDFKNSKGEPIKYIEEWQAIAAASEQKRIEIHLGQFNGYRNWLKSECDNRGRKHGFIL